MKNHYGSISLMLCIVFSACSSIDTGSECLMKESAVSEFATYSWLLRDSITTLDNTDEITPEMLDDIQSEVELGFEDAGYLLIEDADSADFIIAVTLVTQRQMKDKVFFPPIESDFTSKIEPGDINLRSRVTGILTIDAYDGATGLPFWRGWAQRPLNMSDKSTPRKLIRQAVTTIIAQFPHRSRDASTALQAAEPDTAEFESSVLVACVQPFSI